MLRKDTARSTRRQADVTGQGWQQPSSVAGRSRRPSEGPGPGLPDDFAAPHPNGPGLAPNLGRHGVADPTAAHIFRRTAVAGARMLKSGRRPLEISWWISQGRGTNGKTRGMSPPGTVNVKVDANHGKDRHDGSRPIPEKVRGVRSQLRTGYSTAVSYSR